MTIRRKHISRLPAIFQTDPNKKFFAATVDQLFSPSTSAVETGFIGRRVGNQFDPSKDVYFKEKFKNRLNYQLEPVVYTENTDTGNSDNTVFYEDFINRLRYFQAPVNNHDRLFETDFYSFAPPIDLDKFVNFQNYYWLPNPKYWPVIDIQTDDATVATQIIDEANYEHFFELNSSNVGVLELKLESGQWRLYRSLGSWVADGATSGEVLRVVNSAYVENIGTHPITSVTPQYLVLEGTFIEEIEIVPTQARVLSPTGQLDINVAGNVLSRQLGSWLLDGVLRSDEIIISGNVFNIEEVNDTSILVRAPEGSLSGIPNNPAVQIVYKDDSIGTALLVERGVNIKFTNGMMIRFPASVNYPDVYRVEGVGVGIKLVSHFRPPMKTDERKLLNWDFAGNQTEDPENWDLFPWELDFRPSSAPDYLTIERNACQKNEWSWANNWYHKDVLEIGTRYSNFWRNRTDTPFKFATKAKRPIIEFFGNIEMHNRPGVFVGDLELFKLDGAKFNGVVTVVSDETRLEFESRLPNATIDIQTNFEIGVSPGNTIIFLKDTDRKIYELSNTQLLLEIGVVEFGQYLIVEKGRMRADLVQATEDGWMTDYQVKSMTNQAPLFSLYDTNGVSLGDSGIYPTSDFAGSKIFGYAIDELSTTIDDVLGFATKRENRGQLTDLLFENFLSSRKTTYNFQDTPQEITGFYFFKQSNNACTQHTFENEWSPAGRTKQRVIDRYTVVDPQEASFNLSVLPFDKQVEVFINGVRLSQDEMIVENDFVTINKRLEANDVVECYTYSREASTEKYIISRKTRYVDVTQEITYGMALVKVNNVELSNTLFVVQKKGVEFLTDLNVGDVVEISYSSHTNLPEDSRGYYEIPMALESNPNNLDVVENSYADFLTHFQEILAKNGSYRDSSKNRSLGTKIVQHNSSVLKSMLVSIPEYSLVNSLRFAGQEYTRYKNKFLSTIKRMMDSGELDMFDDAANNNRFDAVFGEVISQVVNTLETRNTFLNSHMLAYGGIYEEQTLFNGTINLQNISSLTDQGFWFNLDFEPDYDDTHNFYYLFIKNASTEVDQLLTVDRDYEIRRNQEINQLRINWQAIGEVRNSAPVLASTYTYSGDTITRSQGFWTDVEAGDTVIVSGTRYNDGIYQVAEVLGGGTALRVVNTQVIESTHSICSYYQTVPAMFVDECVVFMSELDYQDLEDGDPLLNCTLNPVVVVIKLVDNIVIYGRGYQNVVPCHIPATPSKLGMYNVYMPEIYTDYTFSTPGSPNGTSFIVGHDGSRTPIFNDERDKFLLEFETRIFNGIKDKFRKEFTPALSIETVQPSKATEPTTGKVQPEFFSGEDTNYSKLEIDSALKNLFYKWANNVQADPREHSYYDLNDSWSYNYRNFGANETYTPSYWRGAVRYYFGTDKPHTHPWECLGFTIKPLWWDAEYTSTPSTIGDVYADLTMWYDIANGIIKDGPRKNLLGQRKYARSWLLDNSNTIISSRIPTVWFLDGITNRTTNPIAELFSDIPVLDSDKARNWQFGDGAPVEDTWKNTSFYPYALVELLYMTKPAMFSDAFWDTEELVPAAANESQLISKYTSRRHTNQVQVHGTRQNGETIVRLGYQQWIVDRLVFMNKNVASLQDAVTRLNVKLGHKVGGFTNAENLRVYTESATSIGDSSALIPSENIEVTMFKGPSIKELVYSGVIVKALSDGRYEIYGYDLISNSFTYLPKSPTATGTEVNVSGKEAEYRLYQAGTPYKKYDIVKYNTFFYRALRDIPASNSFVQTDWVKLPSLPVNGGVEATYFEQRADTAETYDYGTILNDSQEVFDFLVGYGAWLQTQGWVFDQYDNNSSTLKNFLESARQFLFWVASSWQEGSVITLSPLAEKAKLALSHGYADNVEKITNGVYSILDEKGVVIDPRLTVINRFDNILEVEPKNVEVRVYCLRVNVIEHENIILFDNRTSFNDVIYDPLLASRLPRMRLNGTFTQDWTGKFEAPGYILSPNSLMVPNIENTTNSMRLYFDSDTRLDSKQVENAGRKVIGFEEKTYMDNLQISDDVQYEFYKGTIREKGTTSSIKKLLRSVYVRRDQDINVYEEWALKAADFGATEETQRFDLVLKSGDIKTNPQTIVLDTPTSECAYVDRIIVVDATKRYLGNVPPKVAIVPETGETGAIINATAKATLSNNGKLCSIEVLTPGVGYTIPPDVIIGDAGWDRIDVAWDSAVWDPNEEDFAVAILQRKITLDQPNDDLVYIDVDDDSRWLRKPAGSDAQELFPTVSSTNYPTVPTAGYVHPVDVSETVFNVQQMMNLLSSGTFGINYVPDIYDDINEEWTWVETTRPTLWLAKNQIDTWGVYSPRELDNYLIVNVGADLYIDTVSPLPDSVNGRFYSGVVLLTSRVVKTETPMHYQVIHAPYRYKLEELEDPEAGFVYRYSLTAASNMTLSTIDVISILHNLRFDNENQRSTSTTNFKEGELSWIDSASSNNGNWQTQQLTQTVWSTKEVIEQINGVETIVYRMHEPLIDSAKFNAAFLYDKETEDTLFRMPIFDPFKGLNLATVDQNVSYKTPKDPAYYTTSNNKDSVDTGLAIGERNLGKVWLDTSSFAFVLYEQGTLQERRDFWGALVPGSNVKVYEWTRSITPPASYKGPGVPYDVSSYVIERGFDQLSQKEVSYYYFWVEGKDTFEKGVGRTASTNLIKRLIENPRKQNIPWFAVMSHKSALTTPNSLIVNDISRESNNRETVLQLNYKYTSNDTNKHSEWTLLRENDARSLAPETFWRKLTDSIVGMTDEIAWSNTRVEGFYETTPGRGHLLVPDPALSEEQKYGNSFRPRQTWFKDLRTSRKVFVNMANALLSDIKDLRDTQPNIVDVLPYGQYLWKWTTWYKDGWNVDTAKPNKKASTLDAALTMQGLRNNDIVRVPLPNGRWVDYHITFNGIERQATEIARSGATIELSQEIYERGCNQSLKAELRLNKQFRALISLLRNNVFIRDRALKNNLLFFAMLNQSISETEKNDWAMKTSYITLEQSGQPLEKQNYLQVDPFPSTLEYINSVKPYHTKIRDYNLIRDAGIEFAVGSATELNFMKLTMKLNRVSCGGWDTQAWDKPNWERDYELVPGFGCVEEFIPRNGNGFEEPARLPWDLGSWGTCPWDGEALTLVYSGSDPDATYLFERVPPKQTIVVDANNTGLTFTLTFDPILFGLDQGPYVFVNGEQTFDFNYEPASNSITLLNLVEVGGVIELYDVMPMDGGPFTHRQAPPELALGRAYSLLQATIESFDEMGTSSAYKFKMLKDEQGVLRHFRLCNPTGLAQDLLQDDSTVFVSLDTAPAVSYSTPGLCWVGTELIEFRHAELVAPNTVALSSIVRGKYGTVIRDHTPLEFVYLTPHMSEYDGRGYNNNPLPCPETVVP